MKSPTLSKHKKILDAIGWVSIGSMIVLIACLLYSASMAVGLKIAFQALATSLGLAMLALIAILFVLGVKKGYY